MMVDRSELVLLNNGFLEDVFSGIRRLRPVGVSGGEGLECEMGRDQRRPGV